MSITPDSNYVYEKGTIFACPGGGSAPLQVLPGQNGTLLCRDDTAQSGVSWQTTPPGQSTGAAATKGTFTMTAGASATINTTAITSTSVVAVMIKTLGTVTTPKATYVSVTPGTSFQIISADNTDTSSGTWAIVA